MRARAVLPGLVALLLLVVPAGASAAAHVSLSDIEDEVMCPTCGTALSLSESPLAQRQRAFIQRRIDQGRSKEQIKAALVAEFGDEVLASPPRKGFALMAYVVPAGVLLVAAMSLYVALVRRRGDGEPPAEALGSSFDELVEADLARVPSTKAASRSG